MALRIQLHKPAISVYRSGKRIPNELWRVEETNGTRSVVVTVNKKDTVPEEFRVVTAP